LQHLGDDRKTQFLFKQLSMMSNAVHFRENFLAASNELDM